MSAIPPVTAPIIRATLRSRPSNGHAVFIPQIRKLVFEYCDKRHSSAPVRTYLLKHAETLARENPHVEIVVKQRPQRQPIIRGFYMNNQNKVIGLNGYEMNQVEQKIQLLLDASGARIKSLKRKTVVSTTESPRGIWSGLHVHEPYRI
ncbi:hypothetical protein FRB94_014663 [Tulasnella sp. JGI-2019a]|nr:hypothetical protein FRB93_002447 [Tulasnella sp. JGI-2019a]KAG9007095.1 hypothetical protein FRB94_014663 [Tulasnella sp. JGI-2019a]